MTANNGYHKRYGLDSRYRKIFRFKPYHWIEMTLDDCPAWVTFFFQHKKIILVVLMFFFLAEKNKLFEH